MIKSQYKNFQKEKDKKQKLKLAQNTAYLIQVENSLINDFLKAYENQIDPKEIENLVRQNNRLDIEKFNAKARARYW